MANLIDFFSFEIPPLAHKESFKNWLSNFTSSGNGMSNEDDSNNFLIPLQIMELFKNEAKIVHFRSINYSAESGMSWGKWSSRNWIFFLPSLRYRWWVSYSMSKNDEKPFQRLQVSAVFSIPYRATRDLKTEDVVGGGILKEEKWTMVGCILVLIIVALLWEWDWTSSSTQRRKLNKESWKKFQSLNNCKANHHNML